MTTTKTVCGVDISKTSPKHITATLAQLKLQNPAGLGKELVVKGDIEKAVTSIDAWMKKNANKDDLAPCDKCGGTSDVNLDACPYCGEGENNTSPAIAGGGTPIPAAPTSTEATKNMASKKGAKEPKAKTPKAPKPPKEPKPPKAIVLKPHEIVPEGVTTQRLDTALREVEILKGGAAASMWSLGGKMREIHDNQLWKARTDEKGRVLYKNFNIFCQTELKMSSANCYKMMDVSKAFSEQEVRAFGTTKMGLLLEAPEEARAKLMAEVKAGASKRQVQASVKAAKAEAGKDGTKRDTGRKPTPKGKPRKSDTLTIATIEGTRTVHFFAKPANKGDKPQPAKKLTDNPIAFIDLENRVRMTFALVANPTGQLTMKVVTKRLEELPQTGLRRRAEPAWRIRQAGFALSTTQA